MHVDICLLMFYMHHMQVNTNGILSFRFSFLSFFPRRFPFFSSPLIAPYWDGFDLRRGGNIFYRQTSNTTLLERVRDQLQEFPSANNFSPAILFIATWDQVRGFAQPFSLVCAHVINIRTCDTALKQTTISSSELTAVTWTSLFDIASENQNCAPHLCAPFLKLRVWLLLCQHMHLKNLQRGVERLQILL